MITIFIKPLHFFETQRGESRACSFYIINFNLTATPVQHKIDLAIVLLILIVSMLWNMLIHFI